MKKLAIIPFAALISVNSNATNQKNYACFNDLLKDELIEIGNEGIDINKAEELLSLCANIDIRNLDNEEIYELLRNTGWTWK